MITSSSWNDFTVQMGERIGSIPGLLENLKIINNLRERLVINRAEHEIAASFFGRWYYILMVAAIGLSAFSAMLGFLLDANTLGGMLTGAAPCLNVVNTLILGLLALLKYQSRMDAHHSAGAQCGALGAEMDELEMGLKSVTIGVKTEDVRREHDNFVKTLAARIASVNSKLEEIVQMTPVHAGFCVQARHHVGELMKADMMLEKTRQECASAVRATSDGPALSLWGPLPKEDSSSLSLWGPLPKDPLGPAELELTLPGRTLPEQTPFFGEAEAEAAGPSSSERERVRVMGTAWDS